MTETEKSAPNKEDQPLVYLAFCMRQLHDRIENGDGVTEVEILNKLSEYEHKLLELSAWKNVERELPKEDCTVDVWIPGSDYDYKRATDVHFDADNKIFYIDYDLTDITDDVTHWMKKPKPPKNYD